MPKTLALTLVLLMAFSSHSHAQIKEPNVSGQFYEGTAEKLSAHIDDMLSKAKVEPRQHPIGLMMVPHAGHIYSGPVAAYAFKAASQNHYKTIVLLGPTHYYKFDGAAIWPSGGFKTPLGTVEIDEEFAQQLMAKAPMVKPNAQIFEKDHVLEVELPFLQKTFKDFKIVPMIMSRSVSPKDVMDLAEGLAQVAGVREDVLFLISTDLSHYHDSKKAERIDKLGLDGILAKNTQKIWDENHQGIMEIDGFKEVIAGLLYAQKRGLGSIELLKYGHSGDSSGDFSRVVGYAAVIMHNHEAAKNEAAAPALTLEQKKRLIRIAKDTIRNYVLDGKTLKVSEKDARLNAEEGVFVTIHKQGQLRGCIGNILGTGPLAVLTRDMAISAATQDPRFPPLSKAELNQIDVEVSVLSKPKVVKSADEIVLGKHGVIITQGRKGGVFLPQVATDTGWSKEEFLGQLCTQKSGLPADCWKDPKTKIEVFTADVFSEHDVK